MWNWRNVGKFLLGVFNNTERFSNTSGYYDGYSLFNLGLLDRSYNIVDLNIWEIVGYIGPEIDDNELLIDKLKTKTNYDSQVDAAYNAYLDCP